MSIFQKNIFQIQKAEFLNQCIDSCWPSLLRGWRLRGSDAAGPSRHPDALEAELGGDRIPQPRGVPNPGGDGIRQPKGVPNRGGMETNCYTKNKGTVEPQRRYRSCLIHGGPKKKDHHKKKVSLRSSSRNWIFKTSAGRKVAQLKDLEASLHLI